MTGTLSSEIPSTTAKESSAESLSEVNSSIPSSSEEPPLKEEKPTQLISGIPTVVNVDFVTVSRIGCKSSCC